MAKNISLLGADYPDVPAVQLPQTGGGTATFYDIDSLEEDTSDLTDNDYTVKVGSPSKKVAFSRVWNYIKDKISSVLGLTASAYGGKAATAGDADTVNGKTVGKDVPADAVFTDTWNAMTGATSSANGTKGYINATPPKNGYNTKFWRADGTWQVPPGAYLIYAGLTSVTFTNGVGQVTHNKGIATNKTQIIHATARNNIVITKIDSIGQDTFKITAVDISNVTAQNPALALLNATVNIMWSIHVI